MPTPVVSRDELENVHRALRIATPLDALPPLMLDTLAHIAHCWAKKGMPKNLYPALPRREGTAALRTQAKSKPSQSADIDLKRRAAGDSE